jgi:GNAT superfamily N-acetyltransferase
MDIQPIKYGHPLWSETIRYARNCSWKAGPILAEKMRKNDFQNWERVIVAAEERKIVAFCTICERDELPDQYDYTPFIGFVFVDEKYRGMKVGTQLYNYAKMIARTNGCYDITLNVWNLNPGAIKFYEKMGLKPLKITMEEIL